MSVRSLYHIEGSNEMVIAAKMPKKDHHHGGVCRQKCSEEKIMANAALYAQLSRVMPVAGVQSMSKKKLAVAGEMKSAACLSGRAAARAREAAWSISAGIGGYMAGACARRHSHQPPRINRKCSYSMRRPKSALMVKPSSSWPHRNAHIEMLRARVNSEKLRNEVKTSVEKRTFK